MPSLFGKQWTRAELLARVGDMDQVAGIRASRIEGGRASGVRALDVNCGDGFRFTVLPDRCLDIPHLEYRGVPLVWLARNGIVAPEYFEPEGAGWGRSFFGGLLTTCGLRQVGQPCVDDGEALGLHGRISNTPAEHVSVSADWHGDDYVFTIAGQMRETTLRGEDLHLTRTITARAGHRTIHLHDQVENRGPASPLMILYHINLGFPLLDERARLLISDRAVQPKDDHSRALLADVHSFGPPQLDWSEMNYWHDVRPDDEGYCAAALVNEHLEAPFGRGLGLAIRWRRDQLWNLVEWKQLGVGDYVVAIEPANCHTLGRCEERELGTLESIAHGEAREFGLTFSVLVGTDEIAAFAASLPGNV